MQTEWTNLPRKWMNLQVLTGWVFKGDRIHPNHPFSCWQGDSTFLAVQWLGKQVVQAFFGSPKLAKGAPLRHQLN